MKWHQRLQPTRLIDRLRDRLPSPADRPPTDPAQPEVVDVPPTRIEERVASVNRQLQRNMRELREVVIASPAAPILAERYEQLRGTLEPLAPELQGRLRAVSDHLQGLLQWQSTSELAAAQKPRYPDPLRKLVERAQENPLVQQGLQQLQTVTEPLAKPAAATFYRLSLEEKATVIADRTLPVMLTGSGLALLTAGPIGAVAMIGTNYTLTLLDLVDSMRANLDQNYKTSIALSLLAASGVLFLHAGFLATEVIYVASVAAAIAIANKKIPTTSPQSLQVPHGEKRSSR